MSSIALATVLAAAILVASMLSVELALSVALIELVAGVVVGNAFDVSSPDWLAFVASFAGIVLMFLAGVEVDVLHLRREWRGASAIGLVSFAAPAAAVYLLARYGLDWNRRQSEIAGIALAATSVAVVYALVVETGLNRTALGKRLMAATFVNTAAAALALSVLFAHATWWLIPFVGVSIAAVVVLPRLAPWFFGRYGNRVIEPEIKLVFAALFLLMWLGGRASSHAVLPAFVLGVVMSGHYATHRTEQERLRVVAFAFLTPFFFLNAGIAVRLHPLESRIGIVALLLAASLLAKIVPLYPLARRVTAAHAAFTTLLLSTGLTFGAIAAVYGLGAGIIDGTQFSLLLAVIVLSAIVPTLIAQRFFHPHRELAHEPMVAETGVV
jgi:Kef-type K+ transport system membrane component KefB